MKRVQDNRRLDRRARDDDARAVLVCALKAGEFCECAGSAVNRLKWKAILRVRHVVSMGVGLIAVNRPDWRRRDSNPRPAHCERAALPTELRPRTSLNSNGVAERRQGGRSGVMSQERFAVIQTHSSHKPHASPRIIPRTLRPASSDACCDSAAINSASIVPALRETLDG